MQEPRKRVPSPNANLVIAALLGIPGMLNIYAGASRGIVGDIVSGLAALTYAGLLVRDAVHIKKTGVPAMPQQRMLLIGFGCLAVYLAGILLKHAG